MASEAQGADIGASPCAGGRELESSPVLALLADAADHYREALRASPAARQFLAGRGIGGGAAARFGLGYARPAWRDLGAVFAAYEDSVVMASGLVVETAGGGGARRFDRFRDRIMFPIRDGGGVVVGFGGRVLGDGEPKYLNSPEGANFRKRELLYGLHEARSAIQAENVAVVVEGYLDVVSVTQAGFGAVVGSLGTACSSVQLECLLELTPNLVFCFDGDDAGRRAAARALSEVLPFADASRKIGFVFLPDGEDPDSFVRSEGGQAFASAVRSALPLGLFLVEVISSGCNFDEAEGRALAAARARPYWLSLPDGEVRTGLLTYCSKLLGFPMPDVAAMWLKTA